MKRWLITIISLLLVIASLGFIKFTQIQAAIAFGESFPEPSETVVTMKPVKRDWQPTLQTLGEVRATRTLEVRNELEGLVETVNFASGGRVKAGQLLIQLDISTEQAQLEALDAQIQLANLDVKRFSDLVVSRAGSKEQLDRAKAQLAVLQANQRALQTTINRKTIKAPFDGIASIHAWESGTYLAANSLITTVVNDLDTIWIDFSVPQRYSQLSVGETVNVQIPDTDNAFYSAQIIAINQRINANSRSLNVRAKMTNPNSMLKPGAMVTVSVKTGTALDVVAVANEALRFDAFGSFVYVLEEADDGKLRAKRRAVSYKAKNNGMVFIDSGLSETDVVATIGSAKLSEAMWTKVAETSQ